jgi:uncharacterized protein (TIGR03067 family)
MIRKLVLWLAVAGSIAADAPLEDASRKDLERMQGDWARLSLAVNGEKFSVDDAQGVFRTVKADEYTMFRYDKQVAKGTFKIDATKMPRTIDFVPGSGPSPGKPLLGIYEWEGENLKICHAPPGKDRPTDFSAKEGSEHTLTIWEREKK